MEKVTELLLNPFILLFLTIILGLLAGRVKLAKFRLGSSGALFVGLLFGYLAIKTAAGLSGRTDISSGLSAAAEKLAGAGSGQIVDKNIFTMALIFFVAAVGLHAAKNVRAVIKKYGAKFIVLGVLITMVGAGASYLAIGIVDGANVYSMSGIYTGALTSSPGLAAAIEAASNQSRIKTEQYETLSEKEKDRVWELISISASQMDSESAASGQANSAESVGEVGKPDAGSTADEKNSAGANASTAVGAGGLRGADNLVPQFLSDTQKTAYIANANSQVGMGYAIGYPFGVIAVILSMNLLPVLFRINVEEERRRYSAEMKLEEVERDEEDKFDILGLGIVFFAGYLLGTVRVPLGPLGDVSLEVTGGVLITALILGSIGRIGSISFRMNGKMLDLIREISVVFFLAIVGLNYGYGAVTALVERGVVTAVVSLSVAVLSILAGFLVGRYVFKINWIMLSGALCGGMTSTPGLGAAIEATGSEAPAGGYGATYPFALLGMILFTIFLHNMPPI